MANTPASEVTAGDMRQRVAFEKRPPAADGAGNVEGNIWIEQFSRACRITPLRGGEEVTAARLQGTQPALIRCRSDSSTQLVTPQWRARDVRNDVVYNIRTISNVDELNIWLDMICMAGGPS